MGCGLLNEFGGCQTKPLIYINLHKYFSSICNNRVKMATYANYTQSSINQTVQEIIPKNNYKTSQLMIDPNSQIVTMQSKIELALFTTVLIIYLGLHLYLNNKSKKINHIFRFRKNTKPSNISTL